MKDKKQWVRIAMALSMLCLAVLLAACGETTPPQGGSADAAQTDPEPSGENTTMEPNKVYEPEAEVFDSFADLKANADLFSDRAPCTVSTLGYHRKDDGGAATYNIVREKPQGVFEKVGNGIWAVLVAGEQVTPQQFGALGNGKNDDSIPLSRAGLYASEKKVRLLLPAGSEYRIEYYVTFGNVDIDSENAKISYYGMDANTAAVYVESNTNLYGTLNIWTIDNNLVNNGERCALMFGKYQSQSSVTDCYIESVTVTGGSKHTNAVFITGDSHDITIDRIYVPSGTTVNRALLIHWGNAAPYKINYTEKTHTAAADATPTQHPHKIRIGTIECHDLATFEGWDDGISCAVSLCGVYDISVDEIILSNAMEVIHITSGDFGYQYAGEEGSSLLSRDIRIGKIRATGVSLNAIYAAGQSVFSPITDTWPELHIREMDVEGKGDKTRAVSAHNMGLIEIEKMTARGCTERVLSIAYSTRKAIIGELNIINCPAYALFCGNRAGMADITNISVAKINISGSGQVNHAAIVLEGALNGLRIGSLTVDGASYTSLLALGSEARNVRVDALDLKNGASVTSSVVYANQPVSAEQNVSLGNAPAGMPLTAGKSCEIKVGESGNPIDPPVTEPGKLEKKESGAGTMLPWDSGADVT